MGNLPGGFWENFLCKRILKGFSSFPALAVVTWEWDVRAAAAVSCPRLPLPKHWTGRAGLEDKTRGLQQGKLQLMNCFVFLESQNKNLFKPLLSFCVFFVICSWFSFNFRDLQPKAASVFLCFPRADPPWLCPGRVPTLEANSFAGQWLGPNEDLGPDFS